MEKSRYTPENITHLDRDEVFVFGSNLQGRHGGGAARVAQQRFGAEWGNGVGPQGQSYAIPTMQGGVDTIKPYVDDFIEYARQCDQTTFYVTRIGCGIAGFKDEEIAPLFDEAYDLYNVRLPKSFADIIAGRRKAMANSRNKQSVDFVETGEISEYKKMKVLVINGSPHLHGCVDRALQEVEKTLNENGVETERMNVGNRDIRGCIACNFCREHGRCVFNDIVNEAAPKFAEADGLIVGTPTYYAGANGQIHSFMDRLFYSTSGTIDKAMKVGATVVSSRRGGSTSAFDDINKYFTISAMPVASSTYWNEVHGFVAEDVESDLEGLQTMRNLGRNMSFLIKGIALAKAADGGVPQQERTAFTSFHHE